MKRTPLRRQSKKTAALAEVRREVRATVIKRDKVCQGKKALERLLNELGDGLDLPVSDAWRACEGWAAGDVHEVLPRSRGGDAYDPDAAILLCRSCHVWAHGHPRLARQAGIIA